LIRNTSIHAGIRAPVARPKGDVRNDIRCGFEIITARAIDRLGVAGIIDGLKTRVAGTKVYISVDIDVLDPAFAPGKSRYRIYHGTVRESLYQERSSPTRQHYFQISNIGQQYD
jgi:agmatinase